MKKYVSRERAAKHTFTRIGRQMHLQRFETSLVLLYLAVISAQRPREVVIYWEYHGGHKCKDHWRINMNLKWSLNFRPKVVPHLVHLAPDWSASGSKNASHFGEMDHYLDSPALNLPY